jgi:hypothetical protein
LVIIAEHDGAIAIGYTDEGIACYVYGAQVAGTIPLYRLSKSDHFYTTSVSERDGAMSKYGYTDEGIACYVYGAQAAGLTPLYRLSKSDGDQNDHFYTTSVAERDGAIGIGYKDEDIACYVYAMQPPATIPVDRNVLTDQIPFTIVDPRHPLQNVWDSPFFFEDTRHVFFVTTHGTPVPFGKSSTFGLTPHPGTTTRVSIPPAVLGGTLRNYVPRRPGDTVATPHTDPRVNTNGQMSRFVTEDAYIRRGLNFKGTLTYNNRQIGPSGAMPKTNL